MSVGRPNSKHLLLRLQYSQRRPPVEKGDRWGCPTGALPALRRYHQAATSALPSYASSWPVS